jgi:hypothetical protein
MNTVIALLAVPGLLLLVVSSSCSRAVPSDKEAEAAVTSRRPASPTIARKLEQEREARVRVALPVESVVAGLEAAGLTTRAFRQHCASPLGATYCLGSKSRGNLAVSICEYPDPTRARVAQERWQGRVADGFDGAAVINQTTVVTIMQPEVNASTSQELAQIMELVRRL